MHMIREKEKFFCNVLKRELIPALGCTEPIALAYAAAKVRSVLGCFPQRMELYCSGNIIKNVKGVTIPNSGGLVGIDMAVILGAVGGDPDAALKVLTNVTEEDIAKAVALSKTDFLTCHLKEGVSNLYIDVYAYADSHCAQVTIADRHTQITNIVLDGTVLLHADAQAQQKSAQWDGIDLEDIFDFAKNGDLSPVEETLTAQITANKNISQVGLQEPYGAQVGRTLLDAYGNSLSVRARASAAAGSDARMNGCSLPVVINSGSGNQGLTVSLPVLEYASELHASQETLYRSLALSNLVSVYLKHFIGPLSAFCGAVTAACGCGAGITYLCGGDYAAVCRTIINTLGNVGGMICDGAKSSCAAKIASAVDAAILGHEMSMNNRVFLPGEGLVCSDIESTIESIGFVGRVGMRKTDTEILKLMLDNSYRNSQ